jgi:hypothetical protein
MRSTAPLNEDRRRRAVVSAQCDLTPDSQAIALSGRPVPAAADMPSLLRLASLCSSPAVRAVPRQVPMSPPQPQPSLLLKRPPPMWILPPRSQPLSARSSRSCCRPIPVQGGAGCSLQSTTPASSHSAPDSAMTQNYCERPGAQRQPRRPEFGREISRRVQQRKRHFRQSCPSSRSFPLRVAHLAQQQFR